MKSDTEKKALSYINETPELISVLYDINCLPEQLISDKSSKEWRLLMLLGIYGSMLEERCKGEE